MKKVIVIGAGTAGLASAIRLQKNGYDVTILEKNEKVGGRMYQIESNGFKFDVGPTIVMMKDIYEELFRYSGVDPKDYIQMSRVEPMLSLTFADGYQMDASSDLVHMTKTHEAISEKDTQGYLAYLADIYKRYLIAKNDFIDRSFRKPSDFYNPKTLYQALKLKTFSNAYDSIGKFVDDERMRQALAFQTLYIGVSPYSGPSIYTIIPMIELLYGVYYIKGGMYSMAKAMERRFLELGGKILFNQNVSEIVIKDKIAEDVISNHEMITADLILSNADFPYAMDNLIKENKYKKKYTYKRVDKMEYSSSSFLIYLGMNKKYPKALHNIYFTSNFKENVNNLFEDQMPLDPSFYVYSPSQIDESVAPEGKELLYILVPVPNKHHSKHTWTKEFTEKYENHVLNIMAKKKDLKIYLNILKLKLITHQMILKKNSI
ncbi:Dehydrosqualene desaturase [Acholeplasma hippikon]|uniref:Dehydrosqualene desaturase n=1 Tax=Acholeplasma hippikon TaxID=264636 RepID=A0A449BIN2_9MOLU|nr:phytoene desaturase family protein [Acholeplasma hippikon]VEU82263.1 Dehydrosqualene desaturase [Acholeplasma hippikon]